MLFDPLSLRNSSQLLAIAEANARYIENVLTCLAIFT
jgi:hypothetical protein